VLISLTYHGAENSSIRSGDCARSAVFLRPNNGPEAAIRKDAGAASDAFSPPALQCRMPHRRAARVFFP
jgi:hypothetical protein